MNFFYLFRVRKLNLEPTDLLEILAVALPGLVITGEAPDSGQRKVYFGHFDHSVTEEWRKWGEIAIKVAWIGSELQAARLQKEVEILKKLKSPRFPNLLFDEIYVEDPRNPEIKFEKRLFITIESRIPGISLDKKKDAFNSEKSVAMLLLAIIDAMFLLWNHPSKMVHRDLKPDNIMILQDGSPVIIDLGIVREEGALGVTQTSAPYGPGTPTHSSPEQVRNEKNLINFRSDLFSLGIIVYELLTGENPFYDPQTDVSIEDVHSKILKLNPPTLKTLGVASHELSQVVEKMLMKEPYQRFRTIPTLRARLASIIEGIK